jgi:hypothetical protein
VKNFTTQFTKVWLPAMLIGASLMLSAPGHAAQAPLVQAPAAYAQSPAPVIQLAWDRVGSPVRSFV